MFMKSLGGSIRPLLRSRYTFALMPLWSKHIMAYDTFQNIVVIIVLDNGTYVQREIFLIFIYLKLHLTMNGYSYKEDDFQTLMNIVIVYSTCINMT